MSKYDAITGNHRLVGWGDYETLRESILPRVFGYLVRTATPVVWEFHGDLFHDAAWLRQEFDKAFLTSSKFDFMVCVRHSGTNLGDYARYMFESVHYDAALYLFEVQVDGRGEWTLSIDLIDSRPDREGASRSTENVEEEEEEGESVRGCSCGMADYGAPGHDGDPNSTEH